MARRRRPAYLDLEGPDPYVSRPFTQRLADFLLGVSGVMGDVEDRRLEEDEQRTSQQDRGLQRLVQMLNLQRQQQEDVAQEKLRGRQLDLTEENIQSVKAQREAAAEEARRKAEVEQREREAGGAFTQAFQQPVETREPFAKSSAEAQAMSPRAQDLALSEFVLGKRKRTAREASEALTPEQFLYLPSRFSELIAKDVEPEEKPQIMKVGPGEDVLRIPKTGQPEVLRKGTPKEEKPADPTRNSRAALLAQRGYPDASKAPPEVLAEVDKILAERDLTKARETGAVTATQPLQLAPPGVTQPGETILGAKTRIEATARTQADLQEPIGKDAAQFVLKATGKPPDPNMLKGQVYAQAVQVSPQQASAIKAARLGLSILKGFENPKIQALFPEAPFKGKGVMGVLGGAARAAAFPLEAKIRSMSNEEFAALVTSFKAAIPALAKATGEVGNLSESEQKVVAEGIGMARTREAFVAGIRTYRKILERGFQINNIPLPEELRGQPLPDIGAGPPMPPPGKRILKVEPLEEE